MKRQDGAWEAVFIVHTSGKEHTSRIHKELLQIIIKRTKQLFKRWINDFHRQTPTKGYTDGQKTHECVAQH